MNITQLLGKEKSAKNKCDRNVPTIIKKSEEIGESRGVENTGDMTEKCEYDLNVTNNPRTKKQIQILLLRNATEEKQYQNKSSSIESNQKNSQSIYFNDKTGVSEQSAIKDHNSAETSIKSCESLDEKCGERSRFEEIENKLEEMFAGIEDEHLTNIPVEKRPNDASLNSNKESKSTDEFSNMNMLSSNCCSQGVSASNKSSLPTKAAMKSTLPFHKSTSEENKECKTICKSSQHLQTAPIRRRLSIEINSELLKFPIKNNEKTDYEFQNVVDDEVIKHNCSISKTLSLQKSKVIKVKDCNTAKYKIRKNNRRGCIEYKPNQPNDKQKQKKRDVTRSKKNKFKQGQCFLASDNDGELEEKTREIENKNRSPYILVNSNGNITVVNTLMQDEFNEKSTKNKISKTYIERKRVKGCHSSTLSNRYDADKADSNWICVFCKSGPHSKGLGDLFGPYIISTNCDEYQSYKDFIEFSSKNEKTYLPFFTEISSNGSILFNKMVKNVYDNNSIKSHTYDVLDMPKYAENHPTTNYSLGIIKISECSYEIWLHEDCAIWAPNIFIIGSRLTGLEEAIWNSMCNECYYCSKPGALLCCLQRDCKIMAHLPCAREVNWLLDELSYSTLCKNHLQAK